MLLKAEKSICMNKQDLRVSANNLESIVLQSEHFLSRTQSFSLHLALRLFRERGARWQKAPALPLRALFDRTKFPSLDVSSEVAACAPLAVAVCFLLLFLDCFSWTHQVF